MTIHEPRRDIASESPLSPLSLVGSYCIANGERVDQGLVVAEPQPGVYLIEFYDLVTDEPTVQRIVSLDKLAKVDDEGGTWHFYDSHAEVRAAFKELIRR